jgi:pimeloyl-ACP methyl ester carboxylesterase
VLAASPAIRTGIKTFAMNLPNWVAPGSAVLFCAACAVLQTPSEHTRALAHQASFAELPLTDPRLIAYLRRSESASAARVTIYIESDGAPWRLPDEPPADPTPLKPFVMRMAIADQSSATAYLSRPCQYLNEAARRDCDPRLWMQARFSNEAVAATNQAVDQIKSSVAAAKVNLVGYSGGGAMAALVAARRRDVDCLVTVAAPLDTTAWTEALRVSPLDLSLNPADVAAQLSAVRQTHFRGLRDKLVPPATAHRFFMSAKPAAVLIDKSDFDHQCCWSEEWRELSRSSCLAQ